MLVSGDNLVAYSISAVSRDNLVAYSIIAVRRDKLHLIAYYADPSRLRRLYILTNTW